MAVKVNECGQTCPFFLCDNRKTNENCRCFLNPTLNTSMWSQPGKKTFPTNCRLQKKGYITVRVKQEGIISNEDKK